MSRAQEAQGDDSADTEDHARQFDPQQVPDRLTASIWDLRICAPTKGESTI